MKIECNVKLTVALLFDFLYFHASHTLGGFLVQFTGVIFVGLFIYNGNSVLLGLALILLLSTPSAQFGNASKLMRTNEILREPILYVFTNSGIRMETKKGKEEAAWKNIFKVAGSGKSLFFYTSKANAFVIPKKNLEGKEEDLIRLVKDHLPPEKTAPLRSSFRYRKYF